MHLFRKLEEESEKIESNEKILIPKDIKFYKSKFSDFIIDSIVELGDEEDFKILMKVVAKKFYLENKKLFFNDILVEKDNLELVVDNLNIVFSLYDLGSIQLEIDEELKHISIMHYNNYFKKVVSYKDYFSIYFYELFFKDLINRDINVIEKESNNEITIFTINS